MHGTRIGCPNIIFRYGYDHADRECDNRAAPISLSGIGVRESLLEVLLKDLWNLPAAIGVSISVIGYSYFVLFGVIGGIIYLLDIPAGDN